MQVYLELLYHYRCDKCQKWWSIGDIAPEITQKVYCPHCQHPDVVDIISKVTSIPNLAENIKSCQTV